MTMQDLIDQGYTNLVFFSGDAFGYDFDGCIIKVKKRKVVYSYTQMVDFLMKKGLSWDDSVSIIHENVLPSLHCIPKPERPIIQFD